ncbi:MAG: type IV pilus assembly protein PilM [Fimbriimonadaceae bacterium]
MAKKLSSVVGVDIGCRYIKVVEVRQAGGGAAVTAVGMIDTPTGAVDETGLYSAEEVAQALKAVFTEAGVSSPNAVVSLQGSSSVLVRVLPVPRMGEEELETHMQWEVERNNPFAESNPIKDYGVLDSGDPSGDEMDVVMAIASPTAVDMMIDTLKKAGKTAAGIDAVPLSLSRSYFTNYSDEFPSQTVAVVDIGEKTVSINVYRDGKLYFTRVVPGGSETLTQAIASGMGISSEDALFKQMNELVIPDDAVAYDPMGVYTGVVDPTVAVPATEEPASYNPFADSDTTIAGGEMPEPPVVEEGDVPSAFAEGGAPEPADPGMTQALDIQPPAAVVPAGGDSAVFGAARSALDEWVSEIRRSVQYFQSSSGNIEAILVCGGVAGIAGFEGYLNRALGIRCDRLDPFRRLSMNVRKGDPQLATDRPEEFAVAVGNGLYIFY